MLQNNRGEILKIGDVHPAAIALLESSGYAVVEESEDPIAIICRTVDVYADRFGTNLLAIGRAGVGVDTIYNASENGVCVFNAAGANAEAVADLFSHFLIAAARHIYPARAFVRGLAPKLDQTQFTALIEAGKKKFTGRSLKGQLLGIVGFGNVGGLVATDAVQKWKMHVIAYDIAWTDENKKLAAKFGVHIANSMEEVVRAADDLTFHIPGGDANRNIINKDLIAKMKPGANLFNLARADIADVRAIRAALNRDHVQYYFTDLPRIELRCNKKTEMTPHIGGNTNEAIERASTMVAEQIIDYLQRGIVNKNGVNFPLTEIEPKAEIRTRLCIPHLNKPGLIDDVAGLIRNEVGNIESMHSTDMNGIAYATVDLKSEIPDELVPRIRAIPKVLRVNVCRFSGE